MSKLPEGSSVSLLHNKKEAVKKYSDECEDNERQVNDKKTPAPTRIHQKNNSIFMQIIRENKLKTAELAGMGIIKSASEVAALYFLVDEIVRRYTEDDVEVTGRIGEFITSWVVGRLCVIGITDLSLSLGAEYSRKLAQRVMRALPADPDIDNAGSSAMEHIEESYMNMGKISFSIWFDKILPMSLEFLAVAGYMGYDFGWQEMLYFIFLILSFHVYADSQWHDIYFCRCFNFWA